MCLSIISSPAIFDATDFKLFYKINFILFYKNKYTSLKITRYICSENSKVTTEVERSKGVFHTLMSMDFLHEYIEVCE